MAASPRTQEEVAAAVKHRDAILNIRAILATKTGLDFFRYLFDVFGVADLPEVGLEGQLLFEQLGFLRAGKSIFKLVAEADFEAAGRLLAKTEKEKYEALYAEYENGQS